MPKAYPLRFLENSNLFIEDSIGDLVSHFDSPRMQRRTGLICLWWGDLSLSLLVWIFEFSVSKKITLRFSEWSTIFNRVWSGLFWVACSFLCPAFSDGVVKAMVKLWSRRVATKKPRFWIYIHNLQKYCHQYHRDEYRVKKLLSKIPIRYQGERSICFEVTSQVFLRILIFSRH